MSVTAYIYLEDPTGPRANAAKVINSNTESPLEVVPVDSAFGLELGDVLYQGDDSRMLVYEYREARQSAGERAAKFRSFPVWKGDPEVAAWLEAQGVVESVAIPVNYL